MATETQSELFIPHGIWSEMLELARTEAPLEACGLLAGCNRLCIERFYPMTNLDQSAEHFSMMPQEQFAAVKDMRKRGLRMIGIWHSHPATRPQMSPEDILLAFTPNVVYVILSLVETKKLAIAAFYVENGRPKELPCRIGEA